MEIHIELWLQIVLAALVIACFGLATFATLAERAIDGASPTKARYLTSQRAGRLLIRLLNQKRRALDTARLLKVLSVIAMTMISLVLGLGCIHPLWVGILVAALVSIVPNLFVSEIFGSALGEKRPERTATHLAPLLNFFVYVLFPLVWFMELCQDLVGKAFKIKPRPEISERDLMAVITDSYDEGAIEKEEHDLIQNSLNFDDKTIERVMTPMSRAVCADDTMSLNQIRQLFIDNNYSRMPFIDSATGEVDGIIFQRDFYEMLLSGSNDIQEAVKPALFFASKTTASLALKRLQRFRQHMAVVRDGEGRAIGLITVEDLVEELVGEIEDESDAEDIQEERMKAMADRAREAVEDESDIARKEDDSTILPDRDESLGETDTSEDEDYVYIEDPDGLSK